MEALNEQLARIQASLDKIARDLEVLTTALNAPSIGLTVTQMCNTVSGPNGQVVPGTFVLTGSKASDFFQNLKNPTVLPLQDLPPWTHMALAEGLWWLVAMGSPATAD